jgi:hypothetical protein
VRFLRSLGKMYMQGFRVCALSLPRKFPARNREESATFAMGAASNTRVECVERSRRDEVMVARKLPALMYCSRGINNLSSRSINGDGKGLKRIQRQMRICK